MQLSAGIEMLLLIKKESLTYVFSVIEEKSRVNLEFSYSFYNWIKLGESIVSVTWNRLCYNAWMNIP